MNKHTQPHPPDLSICSDCLLWIANGDDSSLSAETVSEAAHLLAVQTSAALEPGTTVFLGGDDEWFSWAPCDACGTLLGGSRHEAWTS